MVIADGFHEWKKKGESVPHSETGSGTDSLNVHAGSHAISTLSLEGFIYRAIRFAGQAFIR